MGQNDVYKCDFSRLLLEYWTMWKQCLKVEGTLHTELLKPEIFNQDAFIGSSSLLYFYKCLECNITLSLFLRLPTSHIRGGILAGPGPFGL